MKLSAKDHLEEVYALADGEERNILYKEKEVALQKLKKWKPGSERNEDPGVERKRRKEFHGFVKLFSVYEGL